MKKEFSAGAVVYRKEDGAKFLILHYAGGHWDFPKGHIEEGESDHETVRRETEEETGISDIQIHDGFNEKISYYFTFDNEKIFKEVSFYVAETTTEEVTLSEEHTGFEWLSFDDALQKLTFNNAKEVLKKAKKFIEPNSKN